MHIHIMGICGTFMGGLARIATELGYDVTGSDKNVYPPMSTQLSDLGVQIKQDYRCEHLTPQPDNIVIGNALSRGNEMVEMILNEGWSYDSGPSWLKRAVLDKRWVIAVSGTHGKTTTTSMVAWILEYAGLAPGFLIGGVPENFGVSARLGQAPYFVIEADEYDTAFFDKRSKFVHYHPKTCIINNIEFDHADIFENVSAIQKQFHHLVRTVPQKGAIIYPQADERVQEVLAMGCWSQRLPFSLNGDGQDSQWQVALLQQDGSVFEIINKGQVLGKVEWQLLGQHNAKNALAAIIAAHSIGVPVETACQALKAFKSVKRRLEKIGVANGVTVYDDFAHHPTAISETLNALRNHIGQQPLIAVLDLRSNSMKMGIHQQTLAQALAIADDIWVYKSKDIHWPVEESLCLPNRPIHITDSTDAIIQGIKTGHQPKSHICVMSNGGFDSIHSRLLAAFE